MKNLFRLSPALTVAAILLAPSLAQADEGMWTFNNFPSAKVGQAYGFAPDQKWLDHVRMSSIRLAQGCSASLVSKDGLVMTNHHCAHSCIEQLSTPERDFVQTGFYAKEEKDEVKCPDMEANQLVQISDVTERVKAALAGKDGKAFFGRAESVEADIAKECSGGNERPALRRRRSLSRRRLQPVQIPPLSGSAAGLRAGIRHRLLRRRPGQFRVPAL